MSRFFFVKIRGRWGEAALTTECECHAAFIEGKRGGSWVKTLFGGEKEEGEGVR